MAGQHLQVLTVLPQDLAEQTFQLITKSFEGFRPAPYQDSVGVWTIGYGSTRDALQKPVTASSRSVTVLEATGLATRDLQASVGSLEALVVSPLNLYQAAACVDFIYNLGSGAFAGSTLRRLLNQRDYVGAALEFPKWDHAGGQILPGLLRRCEARMALFNQPVS